MNYNAIDVAKWFMQKEYISVGADEYNMTNLKIQKLLYYAQGSFLAIFNRSLFNEKILKWELGPVVNEVYHELKAHGKNPVPYEASILPCFSEEEESVLNSVYENFGQYSAWKLKKMTHAETPWIEAQKDKEISLPSIKNYFIENYVET